MSKQAHPLEGFLGAFKTCVGAAFPGERAVFLGHDLHKELKDMDWFDLCAYGILGRKAPKEQLQIVLAMFAWTSYPDARLWNNRVVALAGSTRSTPNLAISAAQAVTDAAIYGRGNEFRAIDFFVRLKKAVDGGADLGEYLDNYIATGGRLAAYGRPIALGDERLPLTLALARQLGIDSGPHMQLAFAVERHFEKSSKPLKMNLSTIVAALSADFGWTPHEANMIYFASFLAGMFPCYREALVKPPGAIFPARCEDVHYDGPPARHHQWDAV